MKILVYGVSNWNNNTPSNQIDLNHEWYRRIIKHIPNVSKVLVTTGNYSDPSCTPFPKEVQIVQNNIPFTEPYSAKHNYFRNGFLTGVWYALLQPEPWDILCHIQTRVLIGCDLSNEFNTFTNNNKQVMCARLINSTGYTMEISLFAMKRQAVETYATKGYRHSFENHNSIYIPTCEEEAFKLFQSSWYNPWPTVVSTRQHDFSLLPKNTNEHTCFEIVNECLYEQLPFISTGKHASQYFIEKWRTKNSI